MGNLPEHWLKKSNKTHETLQTLDSWTAEMEALYSSVSTARPAYGGMQIDTITRPSTHRKMEAGGIGAVKGQ